MDNNPFAEIEYGDASKAQSVGQPIAKLDPVREMFYDMRSLAPNHPSAWGDPKLFYRQGKLMENFVDDCEKYVPLTIYSPSYQRLGYDQLRSFFTWRKCVRDGDYSKNVSKAYVLLYINELIVGLGASSIEDRLEKILQVWNGYRDQLPDIDKYVAAWVRDFFVVHMLPYTFANFVEKHALRERYIDMYILDFRQEYSFAEWAKHGTYNITKSKYFAEKAVNSEHVSLVFYEVMVALELYLNRYGIGFNELFYRTDGSVNFEPFYGALVCASNMQNNRGFHEGFDTKVYQSPHKNRSVTLSLDHMYECRGGRWRKKAVTAYAHVTRLMGYFVKYVEYCMRNISGFRGAFTVNERGLDIAHDILQANGTSFDEIGRVILDQVAKTLSIVNRVVVDVNVQNISRIRDEADVTQGKLIVEDEAQIMPPLPVETGALLAKPQHDNLPNTAELTNVHTHVDETRVQSADIIDSHSSTHQQPNDNPWQVFFKLLTPLEVEAISIALTEPSRIKSFAIENALMLEILADGINIKAMDVIGDNILEVTDELTIYDEYIADICSCIGKEMISG